MPTLWVFRTAVQRPTVLIELLLFMAFNQTSSGAVLTKRIRDSPSTLFPFLSLLILQAYLVRRELLAALANNRKSVNKLISK
jgi:hypothetical protein